MASGTRSIVWRSDIDAGRGRPAFFFVRKGGAGKAQLVGWLVGQLAAQLIGQLMAQLFWKWIARREGKGKRDRGKERGRVGGYLFNK